MLSQNLFKLDFSSANLINADFSGCNLSGANLSLTRLWEADLRRASLDYSNLDGAELNFANLRNAILIDASLVGADLSFAQLTHANFDGAKLSGATLNEARADRASFRNADLEGVRFVHTVLSYTEMGGANLYGALWSNTIFGETELDGVTGLESCVYAGPSILDYGTLEISKDLPLSFLRGCGLPDTLIAYIPSLFNDLLQFYSCFISYSSKDQDFANMLYTDLQNKGVRCWFAPEDLKIGDKIRDRIDESIRLRDKLLLILSASSVTSEWVEHEVESALEEETRANRAILLPIRIDDAVFDCKKAWAGLIRRTRHIGDFTSWKEHDSYQQAFARLLRDLQAEEKTS